MQLLTTEQAWQYRIIPKATSNETLSFYTDLALADNGISDELEMLFDKKIIIEQVESEILENALGRYYRQEHIIKNGSSEQITALDSDDFLVNLLNEAKNLNSSDIHIETYDKRCRVRIRIDGNLIERYVINKEEYPSLINKIKVKAGLDISEKRLPQDGRINFTDSDEPFDIRVSVLPTQFGEKIVMRLLRTNMSFVDINKLGFSDTDLKNYKKGVEHPHGIVLISGPTGSGKTTTLYATLKLLNKVGRNIITIEDPIEYTLEGINQVQLKENIGLTFPGALRSFLRQDPDIIMVGEIRDPETANMAIRAALTGHLVLSTIHTNSAWGTVMRLIDMDIPEFLIASTLNTSVAQRLVRMLCEDCKLETKLEKDSLPEAYQKRRDDFTNYIANEAGCSACHYTGYKGRKAIYEVLPIDQELSTLVKQQSEDITAILQKKKILTLADNAFDLLVKGQTSLDEIYSIIA